jgi:hypothetical protein
MRRLNAKGRWVKTLVKKSNIGWCDAWIGAIYRKNYA